MSALGKPLRGFEKLALSLFGMTQPWSQSMDYSWKKHHPVPTNGRPDMRVLNRAKDNTVFGCLRSCRLIAAIRQNMLPTHLRTPENFCLVLRCSEDFWPLETGDSVSLTFGQAQRARLQQRNTWTNLPTNGSESWSLRRGEDTSLCVAQIIHIVRACRVCSSNRRG